MLIKCTECGHKVSDKADKCPECGCPMKEILKCLREKEIYITDDIDIKDNMVLCSINGKKADVAWIKELVDKMDENERYHCNYIWDKMKGDEDERFLIIKKYMGTPEQVFERKAHDIYAKVWDRYGLSSRVTAKFLCELVGSNFELKEFNGMTEEEYQRTKAPIVIVHCPYCGSIDVKKIFFGGFAQKQWRCNNCRSDF